MTKSSHSHIRPLIGITGCDQLRDGFHHALSAHRKYNRAVYYGAGAMPVIIPPLGEGMDLKSLLFRLDGVLFTGSASNVEPWRYEGGVSQPGTLHDPARDATTLPLVNLALEMGKPILGICRGLQEMNVALGGSLHQEVEKLPGKLCHITDLSQPLEEIYKPRHEITLGAGGVLQKLFKTDRIQVNSVHHQGINELAPGLSIEGVASDGLTEAISVSGADSFALGVQWHPEWRFQATAHYAALLRAFGEAVEGNAGA